MDIFDLKAGDIVVYDYKYFTDSEPSIMKVVEILDDKHLQTVLESDGSGYVFTMHIDDVREPTLAEIKRVRDRHLRVFMNKLGETFTTIITKAADFCDSVLTYLAAYVRLVGCKVFDKHDNIKWRDKWIWDGDSHVNYKYGNCKDCGKLMTKEEFE